ncbi:MAG: hypothetical protein LUC98_03070 [Lachnospiraceae bacterium]|nr:hypothetical protein [Lachnospiraceae bacterium]
MTEGKARVTLGLSVVTFTKYLMGRFNLSHEDAYKKLINTDFFERLNDLETGLYLEPDQYLCKACVLELEQGKAAMYDFINEE